MLEQLQQLLPVVVGLEIGHGWHANEVGVVPSAACLNIVDLNYLYELISYFLN
jgi:hypothetical protein